MPKLGYCHGDGCVWKPLTLDHGFNDQASCRKSDKYLLKMDPHNSMQMFAGILKAKSEKYAKKCQGQGVFFVCAEHTLTLVFRTQFPSGKKTRERQGEGVGATVLFEQSVDMSAAPNISAAQLQETRQKSGLREVACEQP